MLYFLSQNCQNFKKIVIISENTLRVQILGNPVLGGQAPSCDTLIVRMLEKDENVDDNDYATVCDGTQNVERY